MSVTLKDIALKAGVSISTVSRIINNDPNKPASKETIERVKKIIEELGYPSEKSYRSFRKKRRGAKTQNIGCILSSQSNMGRETYNDLVFSQILTGIQNEAYLNGFSVGYALSYAEQEKMLYQHIQSSKVDGIIVMGKLTEDFLEFVTRHNSHVVYTGYNRLFRDIDEVVCDAYESTKTSINYLIGLNHKDIGFLGSIPNEESRIINNHRYRAFTTAMERANLPVIDAYNRDILLSTRDSYLAMSDIIDGKKIPSAVFCSSDAVAMGALRAIIDKGLKIPEDISIVGGIDNINIAEYFQPSLTSITVPKEDLGRFAAKILIDRITGGHSINCCVQLPYELTVRESCRPNR